MILLKSQIVDCLSLASIFGQEDLECIYVLSCFSLNYYFFLLMTARSFQSFFKTHFFVAGTGSSNTINQNFHVNENFPAL